MRSRPLAFLGVFLLAAGLSTGCGGDERNDAGVRPEEQMPSPPPAAKTPSKPSDIPVPPPSPGPTPISAKVGEEKKPAPDQPSVTGVPKLTGDKEKDRAAVTEALKRLKTEWEANQKALEALTQGGKNVRPDPEELKVLKAKNDEYRARAEKLQEALDQIAKQ
jgi:hypothetical protein